MVQVRVEGRGALARTIHGRAGVHAAVDLVGEDERADVVVATTGVVASATLPTIVPSLRQGTAAAEGDLTVAGFWGGLGSLLAAVAVEEAVDAREVHVAYGFPGARRLLRRASPSVRRDLVGIATDDAVARIDRRLESEQFGEGRRLAWFPQPVGPAHAVAVGGLEYRAALDVPTVRTWVAAKSLTAEVLQAIGRWRPDGGPAGWLRRRAAAGGRGAGATDHVQWAVVVECRDGQDGVVRAWANGTDPLVAAADLLLVAAVRIASQDAPADRTVVGLGDVRGQLDAAADRRSLRWSVSRPEPSPR